jgi:hypothetical protein
MAKRLPFLGVFALLLGCDPLGLWMATEVLAPDETEHLVLRNEPNDFYRKADHHKFRKTESYAWENCGTQAVVDCEVKPSCPNHWNIKIWDAADVLVFDNTFHAPHCWKFKRKDWDPMPTAAGQPGTWRIQIEFDIDGVKDCEIHIQKLGQGMLAWTEGVENERPWVQWTAHCSSDRDVDDSHAIQIGCEQVDVTIAWTDFTDGLLEVTVLDGAGATVYHTTVGPTDTPPVIGLSSGGPSGSWTVQLHGVGITAEEITVKVQSH